MKGIPSECDIFMLLVNYVGSCYSQKWDDRTISGPMCNEECTVG